LLKDKNGQLNGERRSIISKEITLNLDQITKEGG
jgi:hypothetical protein